MSVGFPKRTPKALEYPYSFSVEKAMRKMYVSLSEKDKRRYAAIEVLKLPHGGRQYICDILGCTTKTVDRGRRELNVEELGPSRKIRQSGGGAKKQIDKIPFIDDFFLR